MNNFKVSVKSFIVKDKNLLILKRRSDNVQKPNIWELPGGRLKTGEDPREGLKRETREETGLNIEVLQPINVRHFVRDDKQTITLLIFLCKASSSDIKISEEHCEFDWIPLESCKDKLTDFFHQEVEIFNKLDMGRLLS